MKNSENPKGNKCSWPRFVAESLNHIQRNGLGKKRRAFPLLIDLPRRTSKSEHVTPWFTRRNFSNPPRSRHRGPSGKPWSGTIEHDSEVFRETARKIRGLGERGWVKDTRGTINPSKLQPRPSISLGQWQLLVWPLRFSFASLLSSARNQPFLSYAVSFFEIQFPFSYFQRKMVLWRDLVNTPNDVPYVSNPFSLISSEP